MIILFATLAGSIMNRGELYLKNRFFYLNRTNSLKNSIMAKEAVLHP